MPAQSTTLAGETEGAPSGSLGACAARSAEINCWVEIDRRRPEALAILGRRGHARGKWRLRHAPATRMGSGTKPAEQGQKRGRPPWGIVSTSSARFGWNASFGSRNHGWGAICLSSSPPPRNGGVRPEFVDGVDAVVVRDASSTSARCAAIVDQLGKADFPRLPRRGRQSQYFGISEGQHIRVLITPESDMSLSVLRMNSNLGVKKTAGDMIPSIWFQLLERRSMHFART